MRYYLIFKAADRREFVYLADILPVPDGAFVSVTRTQPLPRVDVVGPMFLPGSERDALARATDVLLAAEHPALAADKRRVARLVSRWFAGTSA